MRKFNTNGDATVATVVVATATTIMQRRRCQRSVFVVGWMLMLLLLSDGCLPGVQTARVSLHSDDAAVPALQAYGESGGGGGGGGGGGTGSTDVSHAPAGVAGYDDDDNGDNGGADTATKATSTATVSVPLRRASFSVASAVADVTIGSGTANGSGVHGNMTYAIRPTLAPVPTQQFVTHQAVMTLSADDASGHSDTTADNSDTTETAIAIHAAVQPVQPPPTARTTGHVHRARHSAAASNPTVKTKLRKRLANGGNTAASSPHHSDTAATASEAHQADAAASAAVVEPPLPLGVCQIYSGSTCDAYLRNQSVFVPPHLTIGLLEGRLKAAYGVIRESKDMNPNCRGYALPSLCYSILPICRTPEKTNHQYFANKANHEHFAKKSAAAAAAAAAVAKQKKSGVRRTTTTTTTRMPMTTQTTTARAVFFEPHIGGETPEDNHLTTVVAIVEDQQTQVRRRRRSFDVHIDSRTRSVHNTHYLQSDDFSLASIGAVSSDSGASQPGAAVSSSVYGQKPFPPTRSTENLRRICRNECELLENELCQKEYAIAKRHPTIGQMLPLEDCFNLPDSTDCSKMGIAIDSDENEMCYWENGSGYRGTVAVSASGKPCLQWARLMMTIANYPELAGRNYCRNPGGSESGPWCFVDNNLGSLEKSIELCAIPRCSDKMWLYVIVGFISVASVIVTAVSVCCCKRYRKQASMSNIQNMNLPNVDKNIYGNSRLNSPIEMTSLLHNNQASNIPGMQPPTGRNNSALRVTQYTLGDVRFVEELGEGAFGKVYKGELSQPNGDKIFVAVKALKENASAKTQADFKREIELISDLRHDNIVCILGVVLKEEPLCMLFEYMTQGDLHEFLIGHSPNEGKALTQLQFLLISMQICEGMEYLSGHHYVHRDLAARNCLVGGSLTVKISDFGLSRDIYSSDYYRVQSKSLLPVRWMPSESILYGKFTTESDVWSYGVVLWEIYSYGLQPYYGYSNQEVISMVRARQLLPCPEVCPSAVYTLMVECWHEQAVRRPSFPEIGHRLKIWYQAQKRNDLTENTSLCPSRKGSTFSVLSTNRPNTAAATSITPSTSTHQLSISGSVSAIGASNSNTLGRDREQQQHHHHHHHQPQQQHPHHSNQHSSSTHIAPKDAPKERYGAHHHSLDREKLRLAAASPSAGSQHSVGHQHHQHHHHHNHQSHHQQNSHPQHPPTHNNHHHHHHHHHRSLDRDSSSNSSKSNASTGNPNAAATSTGLPPAPPLTNGARIVGAMPRSRSSNNSLSNIAAPGGGGPQSTTYDPNVDPASSVASSSSPSHQRRSQIDADGVPMSAPAGMQSRSNSRTSMHRPPKDPKSSGGHLHHQHHHGQHHHHHHHQDDAAAGGLQRKKSIGHADNGHRKLSAAGSMSSMHSEASGVSAYSQHSRHVSGAGQPVQQQMDGVSMVSAGGRASS